MENLNNLSNLTPEAKTDLQRMLEIGKGGGGGDTSSLKNIVDAENGGIIEGLVEDNLPDELKGGDNANKATGRFAHVEGGEITYWGASYRNVASGNASHAEGCHTVASNVRAHSEGYQTTASGMESHSEGRFSQASGGGSHAECSSTASGQYSHSEGYASTASGSSSHAEGDNSIASGDRSHAEGSYTTASGRDSHASGAHTTANTSAMFATGMYNNPSNIIQDWVANTLYNVGDIVSRDRETYRCKTQNSDSTFNSSKWDIKYHSEGDTAFVIGNGNMNNRSNAMRVDWDGNQELSGSITLGKDTADEVTLTPAQLKELKQIIEPSSATLHVLIQSDTEITQTLKVMYSRQELINFINCPNRYLVINTPNCGSATQYIATIQDDVNDIYEYAYDSCFPDNYFMYSSPITMLGTWYDITPDTLFNIDFSALDNVEEELKNIVGYCSWGINDYLYADSYTLYMFFTEDGYITLFVKKNN